MDRPELRKLWGLLPPKLDLKKFMKVTLDEGKPTCTQYVLRGIIVYYGRHYWAYFYSQKFDRWYQFNDERLTSIGDFKAVIEKAVLSRCIPRTVFYERSDIVVNFLTEGGLQHTKEQDLIYFSDTKMKTNHFWTNGPPSPRRVAGNNRPQSSKGSKLAEAWQGFKDDVSNFGHHGGGGTKDDCTLF